jgi:cytidylate kinase
MIVTISREYGAGGLAVAGGVAAAFGYELFSDQIPAEVAARLGTSSDDVDARAESEAPLAERILVDMGAGSPQTVGPDAAPLLDPFDEDVRREIERAIRDRAARGKVVILGRVGNAVLAGMPGLARAFVYAERDWRLGRLMTAFGFDLVKANSEIDRIDVERRKFANERYKVAWGDRRYYDVIVDASRLGIWFCASGPEYWNSRSTPRFAASACMPATIST